MSLFLRAPVRILESAFKRCGNCLFRGDYQILMCLPEWEQLRVAAQKILDVEPHGPLLKSEDMIVLASFYEQLAAKKVYCRKEKASVSFMEPACSLWQPRQAPLVFAT